MTRGVLRLCAFRSGRFPDSVHPVRLFSGKLINLVIFRVLCTMGLYFTGSVRLLEKSAGKPVEAIKGVPYKNLTIGVPKEKWTNERRYTNS